MAKTSSPNPVLTFLSDLLSSGKMTKEKICVVCDIKYPTFDNIFSRPLVSPMIRKSLLYNGIIPKSINSEYDLWYQQVWKQPIKRRSRAHSKGAEDYTNQHQGTNHGAKEVDE